MKKLLSLCIVALALLSTTTYAQAKFGVKAGVNITSMKFKNAEENVTDPENRCGFFLGPTAEFKLPIIGLGMDASLLYNQKTVAYEIGDEDLKLKQKSFALPINIKGSVGLGSLLGVYGAIGPQFDFGIGDKKLIKELEGMEWKSCVASLNLGVGVKVLSHIQAGITYNIGLSKAAEYKEDTALSTVGSFMGDAFRNANSKSNTWAIHVAYMF